MKESPASQSVITTSVAALGWETVARFVWIRCNSPNSSSQNTSRFRQDAIICQNCLSSLGLIDDSYPGGCEHIASGDAELTLSQAGPSASPISGTFNFLIILGHIQCAIYSKKPVYKYILCKFCSHTTHLNAYVRVSTLNKLIEKMFGGEIRDGAC